MAVVLSGIYLCNIVYDEPIAGSALLVLFGHAGALLQGFAGRYIFLCGSFYRCLLDS